MELDFHIFIKKWKKTLQIGVPPCPLSSLRLSLSLVLSVQNLVLIHHLCSPAAAFSNSSFQAKCLVLCSYFPSHLVQGLTVLLKEQNKPGCAQGLVPQSLLAQCEAGHGDIQRQLIAKT